MLVLTEFSSPSLNGWTWQEAMKKELKLNTRKTQKKHRGCGTRPLIYSPRKCRLRNWRNRYRLRIAKGRATFVQFPPIWRIYAESRNLTWRKKLNIFRSNVKTVLIYGCETWKVTTQISHSLQVSVNRYLLQILGVYCPRKSPTQIGGSAAMGHRWTSRSNERNGTTYTATRSEGTEASPKTKVWLS